MSLERRARALAWAKVPTGLLFDPELPRGSAEAWARLYAASDSLCVSGTCTALARLVGVAPRSWLRIRDRLADRKWLRITDEGVQLLGLTAATLPPRSNKATEEGADWTPPHLRPASGTPADPEWVPSHLRGERS